VTAPAPRTDVEALLAIAARALGTALAVHDLQLPLAAPAVLVRKGDADLTLDRLPARDHPAWSSGRRIVG
jgi:hypothetical protein